MQWLELRLDIALQLAIRLRARRAWPESDRLARIFERGRAAEIGGCSSRGDRGRNQTGGRKRGDRPAQDFFAEHIYPSVKLRSRSSESNHGSTNAGGARKIA